MNRIHSTKARIVAVLVLALSTFAASLGSLAVLNDTFVSTNNFSVATIDLTGNTEQSVSHDFAPLFNGSPYAEAFAITLNNAGSAELRYAMTGTGSTGNATWNGVGFTIHSVASPAACTTALNSAGALSNDAVSGPVVVGSNAPGQQAGDRVLAAGASEVICFVAKAASPTAVAGTYTKLVNFEAESTYLNP